MAKPAMTAEAVTARLRSALDLGATSAGEPRVDMSADAITARLRDATALSDLCLRLAEIGRAARARGSEIGDR